MIKSIKIPEKYVEPTEFTLWDDFEGKLIKPKPHYRYNWKTQQAERVK